MLRTIKATFDGLEADKLHSSVLCEALGEGWNGKLLSNRLRPYDVGSPTTMEIGNRAAKGYYKHQFKTAWTNNL